MWVYLAEDTWGLCGALSLIGEDLATCARAAFPFIHDAETHQPITKETEEYRDFNGRVLTLLLYLAGDPDVVRIVHPGEKPLKPKIKRTDPERYRDLSESKVYAVGKTFTRAIERWEIQHKDDLGMATGRTVRPHMRRAHSQLYWTGEGRTQPRVRFKLPISVKGGKLVEEPEQPTEIRVR